MTPVVLLVTDDAARDRELGRVLRTISVCRATTLDGFCSRGCAGESAVIVKARVRTSQQALDLRRAFSEYDSGTPILWISAHGSHHEQVQAYACGATKIVHEANPRSILAELKRALNGSPGGEDASDRIVRASARQTAEVFANLFAAGAVDHPIDGEMITTAVDSVTDAIRASGIGKWVELVSIYDDVTYQHCLLVAGFAAAFARSLGFGQRDQDELTQGAVLHDLGKAKVPLAILNKPGVLTDQERSIMRVHPRDGYNLLLAQAGFGSSMLDVVLHHHEMLDGSGYPDGLMGRSISDIVRLTTICDVYASLLQRRPYKAPLSAAKSFEILESMNGKLEAALVGSFRETAFGAASGLQS